MDNPGSKQWKGHEVDTITLECGHTRDVFVEMIGDPNVSFPCVVCDYKRVGRWLVPKDCQDTEQELDEWHRQILIYQVRHLFSLAE